MSHVSVQFSKTPLLSAWVNLDPSDQLTSTVPICASVTMRTAATTATTQSARDEPQKPVAL
jgi:hypothetical protein